MPLENMLTLIKKLQGRIDSPGDALKKNEMLTRYALIDPLLRELGWDTEDPDVVVPEYRSDGGRPDYALHKEGKPIIMLEAKSLDTPLKDAVKQVINYCMHDGTEYSAVTDGRRWEIYETHKPVPIDEKRITSFDLKDLSVAEVCLKVLALWRPSVISGQITVGATPVIGLPDDQQSTTEPQPSEVTSGQPISLSLNEVEWVPLSELENKKGHPSPTEIMFPDGSHALLKHQYKMLTKVVRWLIENGHLSEKQCPIPLGPQSKKSLVDVEPVNFDGTSFSNPKKEGSLHINTHGNLQNKIARVKRLIEHVGQDPDQFKVRIP